MDNLRDRQSELAVIVQALDEVLSTKAWQTLKELLWDKEAERIERLLLSEAKKVSPDIGQMRQLQGELSKALRYSDLKSYAERFKKELSGIKNLT